MTTDGSGGSAVRQWYEPYGEVRWSTGELPTDYGFTGQRHDESIRLVQMGARWYDARIGRLISADTIVPTPKNPQDLNRYAYCGNRPLILIDPSGHISESPYEQRRADEILNDLLGVYDITIYKDWGWLEFEVRGQLNRVWNPGKWQLGELETVQRAVHDLAGHMGGASQFRANLGGVTIDRKNCSAVGLSRAHSVWLRSASRGGFLGQWQAEWTVVHELAHAWDAKNGWQLSVQLEAFTGGSTTVTRPWLLGKKTVQYTHGGMPPKGADANFTREEDFAESVTTFVYPQVAQAYIPSHFQNPAPFLYSNFYQLPRSQFVTQLGMIP